MSNPILDDMRPYLKGFLGCLTAFLLVTLIWGAYHAYQDHVAVHQLIAILNQLASKHADLFK